MYYQGVGQDVSYEGSTMTHRLKHKDQVNRTAVCTVCGPGPMWYRHGAWVCTAVKDTVPVPWYYDVQPQYSDPRPNWWTWPSRAHTADEYEGYEGGIQ